MHLNLIPIILWKLKTNCSRLCIFFLPSDPIERNSLLLNLKIIGLERSNARFLMNGFCHNLSKYCQ